MFHVGFVAKCALVYFLGVAVIMFVIGSRYWDDPSFREMMPVVIGAIFLVTVTAAYAVFFARRSKIELPEGAPLGRGWKAADFGMMLR